MNNILKSFKNSNVKIILIIFSILTIIPTFSQAVSVPVNYTGSWNYQQWYSGTFCKRGAVSAGTNFWMHLDKQFILQAEGVKNLDQNESTLISPGVNLVAYNYPVTGSYSYASADYGTPPMDGLVYDWEYGATRRGKTVYIVRNKMSGGVASQPGYTLTSNNNSIIDCSSGNRCITKGDGTAVVTVSFPNLGSYYVQRNYQIGNYYNVRRQVLNLKYPSCRSFGFFSRQVCEPQYIWGSVREFYVEGRNSAQGAWNYSLSPITYTVTVKNPNKAPTVNYNNTNNISYNTATSNWSYSDPEGDPQTNAVIQIATDSGYSNIIWTGYAGTASNIAITGLTPGTTYYPRVAVKNVINDWTGWENGDAFTTQDYPEPIVNYSLNKTGDTNTAVQKGGTLTLKTGDSVSANWNITNNIGVVGNSCKISSLNTTGGDNTEIYNNTGLGFTGDNVLGKNLPVNVNDQRYTIRLECAGRPAKIPRSINETITLRVESYPTVSCRVDGSTTVKAGDTDRNITANIGNVAGYSWEAGVDNSKRDKNKKSGSKPSNTINPDTLTIPLTYSGTEFGRYTPWVKIIPTQGTSPAREVIATCGRITNLGASNIREVR